MNIYEAKEHALTRIYGISKKDALKRGICRVCKEPIITSVTDDVDRNMESYLDTAKCPPCLKKS